MIVKPIQLTDEDVTIRNILRQNRSLGARSMPIIDLDDHGVDLFEQVYEDPTEKIVEFAPKQIWQIGEENIVEYSLPLGFEEAGSDWIGIYKVCITYHLRIT